MKEVFPSKFLLKSFFLIGKQIGFRYAKDIILVIVITQSTSLIHRYFWWLLLLVRNFLRIYLIYLCCFFRFHFMRFIKELCCSSFHPMLNYVVVGLIKNKMMSLIKRKVQDKNSLVISQKNFLLFVVLLFIQS